MQSTPGASASRLPTVVIALAIVLALIGIGGVAFGAADKPAEDVASGRSTTTTEFGSATTQPGETTTTVAGGIGGGAAGATTTTAKAGGSTATTAASKPTAACPEAPATAADPGKNQPPALGRYTYVSCTDSSDTLDTTITAGNSSNGVTRRNVNANVGGSQQTSSIAYGPAGVTIEALSFDFPQQGRMTCDLNPDVQNFPADMHVGAQWTTSGSCDIKNSKGAKFGTIKIDATGKITGKVAASVAGTSVNAWAVEGSITLTAQTTFGSQTTHINQRGYYDAAHGIEVYRHTEASSGDGQSITRDEKLASLTPKS